MPQVRPSNLEENIATFFSLFPHLEPDQQFTLEIVTPGQTLPAGLALPTTLRQVVTHHWDIQAVPRRYFFELLSHFTPDELEREKLQEFNTAEGQQDLYDYVNRPRRNILEVLHDFRHATPAIPPDYLWDLLPAIKPRSFSIASSPACSPAGRLELLVAVVTYRTVLQQPRRGLCSTWLSRLVCGARVPVRVRPGTLRLPPAPAPLVMVGPGTGVAPFRSFLLGQTEPRPALLFFGCRNNEADFYFQHEWPGVAELEVVTAFSRDQEDKVYINSEFIEGFLLVYCVMAGIRAAPDGGHGGAAVRAGAGPGRLLRGGGQQQEHARRGAGRARGRGQQPTAGPGPGRACGAEDGGGGSLPDRDMELEKQAVFSLIEV